MMLDDVDYLPVNLLERATAGKAQRSFVRPQTQAFGACRFKMITLETSANGLIANHLAPDVF